MAIKVDMRPKVNDLRKRHRDMLAKLKDNVSAFKKVAILLDRWVQKNFRTEGGNVGKWQRFAQGGRRVRGGIDTSAKLLQDTGRLRVSFTPFASRDNAGIGSDVVYSEFHNFGVPGKLPQRRMLPVSREIFKEAKKIIERHVDDSGKTFKGK